MTGASYASVSVYAGDGAQVSCYRYPEQAPILSLLAAELSVTVSSASRSGGVTCRDVEFALALVRAAMIYQHATKDRDRAIAKALGGFIREVQIEPESGANELPGGEVSGA